MRPAIGRPAMLPRRRFDGPRPSLLRLWAIVTAFWTGAMLLHVRERCGADCRLDDRSLWLGLLIPPLVLAAVMATLYWFPVALRRRR